MDTRPDKNSSLHDIIVILHTECDESVAPPIEGELSFSIWTFFSITMTSLIERQLESSLVEHTPQYEKETKRFENNIVETTKIVIVILCSW